MVAMVKRGEPLEVGGYFSLPADLTWSTTRVPGPLSLSQTFSHSLTDLVLQKMGVPGPGSADNNNNPALDLEAVPDQCPELEEDDFSAIQPLEDTEGFRWLPPALPKRNLFKGIGRFVDSSGQLYVQVNVQRRTPRVIRALLNQKFRDSSGDQVRGTLRVGQDCCARWKDGNWYRARVVSLGEDMAGVYLVDYGNTFQASLADIRQEVFAHRIPVQVLRVELAGARPLGPGNTWSDRALEFMDQQIQDKKIFVELVDRTRQPPTVTVTIDRTFSLAEMLFNLEGDFVELGESDPSFLLNHH